MAPEEGRSIEVLRHRSAIHTGGDMMRVVKPPPPSRRRFRHVWDELDYVVEKVVYWLYERRNAKAAARYHRRLNALVREIGNNRVAIVGNLARGLLAEMEGDVPGAIRHRERQLKALERYFAKHAEPQPHDELVLYLEFSYALYGRLGELYADSGKLDRGIQAVERYKRLCEHCHVRFRDKAVLHALHKRKGPGRNKSTT